MYPGKFCDSTFKKLTSLRCHTCCQHTVIHYPCPWCGILYTCREYIKIHVIHLTKCLGTTEPTVTVPMATVQVRVEEAAPATHGPDDSTYTPTNQDTMGFLDWSPDQARLAGLAWGTVAWTLTESWKDIEKITWTLIAPYTAYYKDKTYRRVLKCIFFCVLYVLKICLTLLLPL